MHLTNVIFKQAEGYCRGDITIENGRITAITITDAAPTNFSGIEFYVTPGFVNSHLHPNQLFDRRLMDEVSISEIFHLMHQDYKKTDDDRYAQALFVLIDAIKHGTTSAYAVATSPAPVIKAFKQTGLKGAITCFYNDRWEGYGDAPTLHKQQEIEALFAQARTEKTEAFDIHIGSASIESASNELLLLFDAIAQKFDTKVNIHISEGQAEIDTCRQHRGTTPIRLLAQLGVLGPRWNLIHATNIDSHEVELIARSGATMIHCPVSNAKTGVGVAPIPTLMQAGVLIGLGTDACSNNNTNNMLSEMYFATLIHSATTHNPGLVTTDTVMQWATTNGYKILGNAQPLAGLLESGAPADLLLWSLHEDAFAPVQFSNFDAAIVYNAPDLRPHSVIIDGKVVVENYHCTLAATSELRATVDECSLKIVRSMQKKEGR